ncbi:M20/M25/M40 family metallo-hydrolase [Bacillus tianshenii]|nr:M20/M25/M40 family metallo-hydrolase [Bacillus tianshenii]
MLVNLQTLFIRHGFLAEDLKEGIMPTIVGRCLHNTVEQLKKEGISQENITEDQWIHLLEGACKPERVGGELLLDSEKGDLPFADLDTYVRGIVRWLNELRIYTGMCCDGHNKRPARIWFKYPLTFKQKRLLKVCAPSTVDLLFHGSERKVSLRYKEISDLLEMAERLYAVWQSPRMLDRYLAAANKAYFKKLFNIVGESGNERRIRQYLVNRLSKQVDDVYVDSAGNVLATYECGDGPTILLSAHMDTCEAIHPTREIIENGTVLSSSKGIFGADDRAGIGIILKVIEEIHKLNFNGTIKLAFTVKEEIGCVGAIEMDRRFLENVDAAIVVDRRNSRDIVTSRMGIDLFCEQAYGRLFEQAGQRLGMADWKMTEGGTSDALIFSREGIPSVNLSAGYQYEHTNNETFDLVAAYETIQLIRDVLHHPNELQNAISKRTSASL